MRLHRSLAGLAALAIALQAGVASAQLFEAGDVVIGVNSNTTDSFRVVRNNVGSDLTGVPADSGTLVTGGVAGASPWEASFIQSVEFDNANGLSHNANGNLIGGNFNENGADGFAFYNFATDGSGSFERLWGTLDSGGVNTSRGGGLSVSPNNNYIAWAGNDSGQISVHPYDAGASVGSGSGASITGWIETANGNGTGSAGALTPVGGATSGTAWLNDTTVLAANTFGELITWDISGLTSTDITTSTTDTGWTIAADGLFTVGDYMDVEYQPLVDPDHIIVSVGDFDSGTGASNNDIIVLDATTFAVVDQIDISLSTDDTPGDAGDANTATLREIAYDADGNLFVGGFGENLVSVIPNFAANIGSLADDSSIFWFNNDFFSSFTGMDVAISEESTPMNLTGDADGDGDVDGDDLIAVQTNFGDTGDIPLNGDADFDGDVDGDDLIAVQTNFGNTLSVAIPEPTSAALLLVVFGGCVARRRS